MIQSNWSVAPDFQAHKVHFVLSIFRCFVSKDLPFWLSARTTFGVPQSAISCPPLPSASLALLSPTGKFHFPTFLSQMFCKDIFCPASFAALALFSAHSLLHTSQSNSVGGFNATNWVEVCHALELLWGSLLRSGLDMKRPMASNASHFPVAPHALSRAPAACTFYRLQPRFCQNGSLRSLTTWFQAKRSVVSNRFSRDS